MLACSTEQDINAALQAAVTCAILAPAGSHRSRILSMLYKDERVSDPGAVPQFPFLEKMLMERLVTPYAITAALLDCPSVMLACCGVMLDHPA
jgi:COP9 signalosome complex subunit 4